MQTKGSIGYVEYAYAKQNKLSNTKLINKDGKAVAPVMAAFQAAAANADWASAPGMGVVLTDQAGAEILADHQPDVHPDPQAGDGRRSRQGSPQVLRLGLRQRRQDGRRAGLCSAARQRRCSWSRRAGLLSAAPTASRSILRTNSLSRRRLERRLLLCLRVRPICPCIRSGKFDLPDRLAKPVVGCFGGEAQRPQRSSQDRYVIPLPDAVIGLSRSHPPDRHLRVARRSVDTWPSRHSASASSRPKSGTPSPNNSAHWRQSTEQS